MDRLRILPRAEADITHIYEWVFDRSPEGARRWYFAFEQAARAVVSNPLSYSLAREDEFVDYELRQFLFRTRRGRTYRGVYLVIGEELRLLRVRGAGQRDLDRDELADLDQ